MQLLEKFFTLQPVAPLPSVPSRPTRCRSLSLPPAPAQIASDRSDRRLSFPRQNTEITKYMGAAWRLKEQTRNLS